MEKQAERLGTTLDGLALAAVLSQQWVDVVLSGAATVAQLESNATALRVRWDEQATAALTDVAESATDYWALRSKLVWN